MPANETAPLNGPLRGPRRPPDNPDEKRWRGGKPPPKETWRRQRSEGVRSISRALTLQRKAGEASRVTYWGPTFAEKMATGELYPYPLEQRQFERVKLPIAIAAKWKMRPLHRQLLALVVTGHLVTRRAGGLTISYETLGELVGRCRNTVGTAIRELVKWQFLELDPGAKPFGKYKHHRTANTLRVTQLAITFFDIKPRRGRKPPGSGGTARAQMPAKNWVAKESPLRGDSDPDACVRERASIRRTEPGVEVSASPTIVPESAPDADEASARDARRPTDAQPVRAFGNGDCVRPAIAPTTDETPSPAAGEAVVEASASGHHAIVQRIGDAIVDVHKGRRQPRGWADEPDYVPPATPREPDELPAGPPALEQVRRERERLEDWRRENPPVRRPIPKPSQTDDDFVDTLERAMRSFHRGRELGPVDSALIAKLRAEKPRGDS